MFNRRSNKFVTHKELQAYLCGCCNVFYSGTASVPDCETGNPNDHFFNFNTGQLWVKQADDCTWTLIYEFTGGGGGGTLIGAENGLHVENDFVHLGGNLIEPTQIDLDGQNLYINQKGTVIISHVYFGGSLTNGIETTVSREYSSVQKMPAPGESPIELYQTGNLNAIAGLELYAGVPSSKSHYSMLYYEYRPSPERSEVKITVDGISFNYPDNGPSAFYTFPRNDGAANQILYTDGTNDLNWTDISGLGALIGADNGLNATVTPGVVELGGTLIRNTDIWLGGQNPGDPQYDLHIKGNAGDGTKDVNLNFHSDYVRFVNYLIDPPVVQGATMYSQRPDIGESLFEQQSKSPVSAVSGMRTRINDAGSYSYTKLNSTYGTEITAMEIYSDSGVHVVQSTAGGEYILPLTNGTANQILTTPGGATAQLYWEDISNLVTVPVTAADNGLNITVNPGVVELGGDLIRDTSIVGQATDPFTGYYLNIDNLKNFFLGAYGPVTIRSQDSDLVVEAPSGVTTVRGTTVVIETVGTVGNPGEVLTSNGTYAQWQPLAAPQIITVTSNYLYNGEDLILCDCTAGNITILIPASITIKKPIRVKKIDSTANSVIVNSTVAELIEGAASYTFSTQYMSINIYADSSTGSLWLAS